MKKLEDWGEADLRARIEGDITLARTIDALRAELRRKPWWRRLFNRSGL